MRVLLTGSEGYLGSCVSAILRAHGHDVVGADIKTGIDITNYPLGTLGQYDVLVHTAALVGETACNKDPAWAEELNVAATKRVFQDVLAKRKILFSTCSNYGRSDDMVMESASLHPLGHYAMTKVAAEAVALGLGGTVLRFGTAAGLSKNMRWDLLIAEAALAAARKEKLIIYAPEAWRPFIAVQDIGLAVLYSLIGLESSIYNVVGWNCQKQEIAELAERNGAVIETIDSATDKRDYRASASRFMAETGFEPTQYLRQTFNACLREARK